MTSDAIWIVIGERDPKVRLVLGHRCVDSSQALCALSVSSKDFRNMLSLEVLIVSTRMNYTFACCKKRRAQSIALTARDLYMCRKVSDTRFSCLCSVSPTLRL